MYAIQFLDERLVSVYWNRLKLRPVDIGIRDVDMSPKSEYFLTYLMFKSGNHGRSNNHYRHTQGNSRDGNPDNQTGKRCFFCCLTPRCYTLRYEKFGIHRGANVGKK